MFLAVRALSKSASHLVTAVSVAETSTVRSVLVSVMDFLQVGGCWRFGAQPEWAKYLTGQRRIQGGLAITDALVNIGVSLWSQSRCSMRKSRLGQVKSWGRTTLWGPSIRL